MGRRNLNISRNCGSFAGASVSGRHLIYFGTKSYHVSRFFVKFAVRKRSIPEYRKLFDYLDVKNGLRAQLGRWRQMKLLPGQAQQYLSSWYCLVYTPEFIVYTESVVQEFFVTGLIGSHFKTIWKYFRQLNIHVILLRLGTEAKKKKKSSTPNQSWRYRNF